MEREISAEQYEALPEQLKAAYERDGDIYRLKEDQRSAWWLLLLLLLTWNGTQWVDVFGNVVSGDDLQKRVKLMSAQVGENLKAEARGIVLRGNDAERLDYLERTRNRLIPLFEFVSLLPFAGVPAARRFIGVLIERQVRFIDRFIGQVRRNPRRFTAGRMKMYGRVLHNIYQNADRAAHDIAGFGQERRVLGFAEHCPDCVNETAKGWQPIGTLRAIGDSVCLSNCRCHFEYTFEELTGS